MAKLDVIQGWNEIRSCRSANYESQAVENRQDVAKFGNAKMRRSALYLRSLVQRVLGWSTVGASDQWRGYASSAVDATVVCGPGAICTGAKIHTKLQRAEFSSSHVEVIDDTGGDSFGSFAPRTGELAVGDRGYGRPRGIEHVVKTGAEILAHRRIGPMRLTGEKDRKLEGLELVRHIPVGGVRRSGRTHPAFASMHRRASPHLVARTQCSGTGTEFSHGGMVGATKGRRSVSGMCAPISDAAALV